MMIGPSLPAPLDVAARAVVNHPDQRSGWMIVVVATLRTPPDVDRLVETVPLTTARLGRGAWLAGTANPVLTVEGDPLAAPELWRPLRLADEAPLRVVVSGHRVALAGHHAAFDGRSLLALLRLLGGDEPLPSRTGTTAREDGPRSPGGSGGGALTRLLRPADRVAPSASAPAAEARAWQSVQLRGPAVTARVVAAATQAVGAHNRARGARWRRAGISVGLGGPPGVGNLATYRRIDLDLARARDITSAVEAGIAAGGPGPAELRRAPRALRLLAPVVGRLSDSFLVSNLGRVSSTAIGDVVFFPVARGRSAVAFGAVGSTLSLRARDLSPVDAASLLEATVEALA
ncbi:MAG: hypothetical protein QOG87_996 [Actinomycetota bacterium]|jgi:hypothetical protein